MSKKRTDVVQELRNSFKPVPCIIGIDQSYTRTGLTICVKGKIKKITSVDFKGPKGNRKYIKSKTMKRLEIQKVLNKALDACLKHYSPDEIVVLVERIRTYTASNDLRPMVIKAQSAMVAYIVDTAYVKGVKVFSVDTRHWKTRVLGDSRPIFEPIKGVKNPQKFGSVRKVIGLGFEDSIAIYRNGKFSSYDDDAADSACIALYGFSGRPYHLQLEM